MTITIITMPVNKTQDKIITKTPIMIEQAGMEALNMTQDHNKDTHNDRAGRDGGRRHGEDAL